MRLCTLKTLVLVLLICYSQLSFSQPESHHYGWEENDKLFWYERKLTWDDFQERPHMEDSAESFLSYFFGYRTFSYKVGQSKVTRILAYTFIERDHSWVKPEKKTDQLLKYNQVLFDILELYSRKLQKKIDEIGTKDLFLFNSLISNEFRKLNHHLNEDIQNYLTATKGGINKEKLDEWEDYIQEQLNGLPIFRFFPNNKINNFGYGIYGGVIYAINGSKTSELFTNPFGFGIGFAITFKKFELNLNDNIGFFTSAKKDFQYAGQLWQKNWEYMYLNAGLTLGYSIYQKKKWNLSPQIGIDAISYFYSPSVKNQDDQRSADAGAIHFSFNFDYNLGTHFVFTGKSFKSIYYLRLKPQFNLPVLQNTMFGDGIVQVSAIIGGRINKIKIPKYGI